MPLAFIILREIFWEIIYVPVWWYTFGAVRAVSRFLTRLNDGNDYLGWSVWLFNIFTPMYAQTDLTGRLISIGVRIVQVMARSVLFLGWILVVVIMLMAYFLLPLITLFEIFHQWRLMIM
ncbi:hypothetical protein A3H10_03945 [Candidatus Uhrbacteria bacterium RIFCSPLOWO2_12_FULL_46_10]|uniref:Uncharacterized protein n=1 Tax=Candidatus Uhrbacteria bacterium RIFCSPLOWO2_01_FULL_47_25 TaxID=1802402 RepID=A0A1F7UXY0_9BACT|nr:MAG: hypothetical protein UX68_C0004G0017 [Parcubacteria group bacterium GW2011_GWA2_46_9]OGL61356.1 MAG: hypothetical protein A2752_01560 [Candidatus Uhrbacteria bacterium RIFCSPHIGHO2_01_FULL_46_23]OGL70633.1 MAG: hypothetical protein A3D60_04180 [Candidatus Uhrbacteria bacterium RIFCSPHIGHO2_02_FULL_47_29]OGL74959.1 MAG: hypothetical protein A3E96_05025 [Candidatus Uhrbacteria bacterium RIFCSPHIGHO2_12_FULL_46_13]OGL83140.1 MAG: hypothetical protein A2936_01405 [Candidatus Uhrbacteria bac